MPGSSFIDQSFIPLLSVFSDIDFLGLGCWPSAQPPLCWRTSDFLPSFFQGDLGSDTVNGDTKFLQTSVTISNIVQQENADDYTLNYHCKTSSLTMTRVLPSLASEISWGIMEQGKQLHHYHSKEQQPEDLVRAVFDS
jgi:hypothetical protein